MKLGDLFREAGITQTSSEIPEEHRNWIEEESTPSDPIVALKQRAQEGLFARLGNRLFDASLTQEQLHTFVVRELDEVMKSENIPLSNEERHHLVNEVKDDILGYGPIERFLADPTITEVMVNADRAIYIEREGGLEVTDARFMSLDHLRQVIERIVSQVGRRIDESSPMVDARLPDGSRVNAVIPPLSVDGPMLTIRKFSKKVLGVSDLIELGSFSEPSAQFMEGCVVGKLNLLVSGGTGTGKTTLLNVLSSFIPEWERIVTIEDAVELRLRQRHVVRLESRPANVEGKGQVGIRELVRNSLRMRPDRIVVGEVRGGEALDMLQAMNTGHEGSLSTLHANTPRDALARLETMVLMAGIDLPIRAIREQMASALDGIVHITRMRDGTRRLTQISEVVGMEGDTITLADIFKFDYDAGINEDGKFAGELEPTGLRPLFTEKLAHQGIELPAEMFDSRTVLASAPGRYAV
jgi:pilus assembly protein CpaF